MLNAPINRCSFTPIKALEPATRPRIYERMIHRCVASTFHHLFALVERCILRLEIGFARRNSPALTHEAALDLIECAEPGDILFAQLPSLRARSLQLTLGGVQYTHAGILVPSPEGLAIVHSVRGTVDRKFKNGGVIRQSIRSFLSHGAADLELYRIKSLESEQRACLASDAREAARQRLPFDVTYALYRDDAVYCSEFIWRLGLARGLDLVENRFLRIGVKGCSAHFILPEAIARSPHLHRIA